MNLESTTVERLLRVIITLAIPIIWVLCVEGINYTVVKCRGLRK